MNYRAWLTLAHAWVTVPEYLALRDRFGECAEIVQQPASRLQDAGLPDEKANAIATPNEKAITAALDWIEDDKHHCIPFGSERFPELLAQIPGPPLLLYVNGDVDALHLPSLAIIGSRNPTQGGLRNAQEFSRHLARNGFSIVSGLAQGIDTAAHRGALDADATTVALLGHGIDRVYPAANRALAHKIVERGALVTEYPLGAPPEKWHFPERNRLISGLCLGTLVVEAARRSGTLITARLAAEQGREVFALPGSIHNPLARGCHRLIRQGAKLVETADDIVGELGALAGHLQQNLTKSRVSETDPDTDGPEYRILHQHLSYDPVAIDQLHAQSGLTIAQLSSMLLILELQGEVESTPGGHYALTA